MAIHGITDYRSRTAKLPIIGRIRKGGEKGDKRPGADLDTFRMTSDYPEIEEEFATAYAKVGGLFPQAVGITLLHPEVEQNFSSFMEEWSGSSLLRRCDGQSQLLHLDGAVMSREPMPCAGCLHTGKGCKPTGRLTFMVSAIKKRFGAFTLETHSKWDLITITESLMVMHEVFGSLTGIQMRLTRHKRTVSSPRKGSRVPVEKSFIQLEPHAKLREKTLEALDTRMQLRLASLQVEDTALEAAPAPMALPATHQDIDVASMAVDPDAELQAEFDAAIAAETRDLSPKLLG